MSFSNNTYMQHLSKIYNNKNLCVYPLNKNNNLKHFKFINTNINKWINYSYAESYNANKFINGVELLVNYITEEINKNYWNFRFDECFVSNKIKVEDNLLQLNSEENLKFIEDSDDYRINLDDAYIVFTNSILAPLYVTFIKQRSVKTKGVKYSDNVVKLCNTVKLNNTHFLSEDLDNYGNIFNSTETYFISIEKLMNCKTLYDCDELIYTSKGEIRLYNFNNLFFDYAVCLDEMVKPSMFHSINGTTLKHLRNTHHLRRGLEFESQLEQMYKSAEYLYKSVLDVYKK